MQIPLGKFLPVASSYLFDKQNLRLGSEGQTSRIHVEQEHSRVPHPHPAHSTLAVVTESGVGKWK